MLNNKKIDAAKPKEKLYKLSDGHGLYLIVLPSGVKSWRAYPKIDGKPQTKTFGQYPRVSIAEARQLHQKHKDEIASGGKKEVPTFDEIKIAWLKHKLPTLKNAKHQQQVQYRMDAFASPKLGKKPINTIKRADLVGVVQGVQILGIVETSHRVAMHLRQMFDYAVDIGVLESHPANNLTRVLQTPTVQHFKCVPIDKAGQLLKDILTIEEPLNRLALIFMALTFVRSTEMRYMKRDEIKDKRFWVIPEKRMKGREGKRKPHVVPLSDFALEILAEIDVLTGEYEYVFQSPIKPNQPISENTLLDALYGLGYRHKMTVHGFRSLASTVLNENSPFHEDVIERQLAHKETDAVRAAYNRAEYLAERIELMNWYSEWIRTLLK
jgi:integrase